MSKSEIAYASPEPNLRDFAVALFNSVSSIGPDGDLQPHARVFLCIWKDNLSARSAFEQWSDHLAGVLRVEKQLNDAADSYDPDDDDAHAGETIFLAKAGKPLARLMPLAPPPPQRIPGRLRSQGPLSNPNALLEPMAADELAGWDQSSLLPVAPQP